MPSGTRRLAVAGVIVALAVMALAFPVLVTNPYYRFLGTWTAMFAALASGWNVMGGTTGYVSLGHGAFFGAGAYVTGIGVVRLGLPPEVAILAAIPVIALFAAPIGFVALRTRGASFVIVTLTLVYILTLLAQGARDITGGSRGIGVPRPAGLAADAVHVPFYYAFLALFAIVIVISWWIRRSKFGMGLMAIREDEDKAESLGVDTGRSKTIAFTLSATLVGVGGAIYGYWTVHIDPIFVFKIVFGVNMILMALLGGVRNLWGPALGALILAPGTELVVTQFGETQAHLVVSGVLLAAVVLLMPDGIIPAVQGLIARFRPPDPSIREQQAAAGGETP